MNDHEMDPLVRLRSIDPAAGATYEHADVSALLARVTARPRLARVSFARGFRVRMAGAVAAAALLSLGGIAVLESAAPSLSVLAIGSASSGTHNPYTTARADTLGSSANPTFEPMITANVTFVASPGLSSQTGSAPSYLLTPAGDFDALSQQVATTFGVSGSPSVTPGADLYWTIGNTSKDFVSFWSDDAELNWEYTDASVGGIVSPLASSPPADSTAPTNTSVGALSDTAALQSTLALLNGIGISGPFGVATYSETSDGESVPWTTVSLPWDIGGPGAGFEFDATFDPTGKVIAADGVDVAVSTGASYPIISQVAGVAELNREIASRASSDTTTTINPGGPMIPASPATTVPSALPPSTSLGSAPGSPGSSDESASSATVITLESATIQYAEYGLRNGTEVLLPQWLYTSDTGSQWTVLAVVPAYVTVDSSLSGGIAVFKLNDSATT